MSFLVLNLLVPALLFAQGQSSLLWKITGKGLDKPSYLYGTIHIQDKRVFQYGEPVKKAFGECDAYAMEVLMDEVDQKGMREQMLMKDGSLKKLLSEEDWKELDKALKDKLGMGALIFDKMKPFFVSAQLMQSGLKKDMPLALDLDFLKKARDGGKAALGIEKIEEQLSAIDAISLEEQAKMLMSNVKDTTSKAEQFDKMIGAYLKGDLNALGELMNDTTMPANFTEEFLDKRNVVMAKNIGKFAKKQSTFNAVGAAHLGGEKGVITLLRKKGYTVEPVPFKFSTE